MDSHVPISKLQQLELAHADEGQLVDIKRSDALTTELEKVERGYFLSPQIVGSISSITVAVLYVLPACTSGLTTSRAWPEILALTLIINSASYWAFSPPAAIITAINADIGNEGPSSCVPV